MVPVAIEDSNVEAVAVGVANKHIACVGDVDAIGEVGDVLAADASQEHSGLAEHHYAMALEVAHEILLAWRKGRPKLLFIYNGFEDFSSPYFAIT